MLKQAPTIFYGREELVGNITRLILSGRESNKSVHIPITGSGGMGKTSVALTVIHGEPIVQVFGDNRHWVPCDKTHTIPLLLEHLARMFSVTLESGNLLVDIMSHLRQNNAPRIILIDNFETLWDPMETKFLSEDILSSLRSISNITILLTMRGSVLPSEWIPLPRPIEPLSLDAAKETFRHINPHYTDDQLEELLRALDCWPLAITLVARVGQKNQMKPSALLMSWEKEKTASLEISPDRLESIDISIRLSLRSRSMISNPDALKLLQVLASLPGGIWPENLQDVAPAIREVDAAQRTLIDASLAEYTPDHKLKVLSPIRAHVLKYDPPDASDIVALRRFYFHLVEAGKHDPGTKQFSTAHQSISREESNIRSVIINALENETSVDAIQATIHYSHYLYWNVPSTEVLEKAIDLISSPKLGSLMPRYLRRLRRFYKRMYNFIRRHSSPEPDLLLARCLLRLGVLYKRMDDFPRAVSKLLAAKKIFEFLENSGEAAECCLQLANVYMMEAMHNEAIDVLAVARRHLEANNDQRGLSDYLEILGRVYRRQGNYTKASEALVESRAKCSGDPACVAIRGHVLGIIYRTQGRLDEAITVLDEAGRHFKRFGPPYYVANNIYNLGIVYYMQRHYDKANQTLSEAYDGFEALGNHGMMSWCLYQRGELSLMRGRLEEAGELYGKAMRKFEKLGWAQAVVECLWGQARVFAALYQVDDAQQSCNDALAIIGDQESYEDILLKIRELLPDLKSAAAEPRPSQLDV